MTTPGRWYQLSMLQILVAIAVLAVLAPPNLVPIRSHNHRKSTGFKVDFLQQGFPFRHRLGMEFTTVVEGKDEIGVVYFIYGPRLVGNIAFAAASVMLALFLIGRFNGNRVPISPDIVASTLHQDAEQS